MITASFNKLILVNSLQFWKKMPGVIPSESNGLSRGSPSKKNRLSLKFFQKKETKRALDFTDSQEDEEKASEYRGSEMYVFYFKLFLYFILNPWKSIALGLMILCSPDSSQV